MPCYHRVKGAKKERNCGKKDVVAYKVHIEYRNGSGTWIKIMSFCEEHQHGMDLPGSYHSGKVCIWRNVSSLDPIPIEELKDTKNEELYGDIKHGFKHMFKHKKYRKIKDAEWEALLKDAWEEFIIESVSSS